MKKPYNLEHFKMLVQTGARSFSKAELEALLNIIDDLKANSKLSPCEIGKIEVKHFRKCYK